MFEKARLKLTAWYLLIIMLISISFSLAIYRVLVMEISRVERMQRLRRELQIPFEMRRPVIDPEVLNETENRLRAILIIINLGILGSSALASYFLAGRTLKPIKDMVEEQSRFITDASHELRTPLTSLKSEIEVNLRDKNLKISDAKKLLESNLEEVNNLQYLSDNLIKLTQYQTSSIRVSFEQISLLEIIDQAQKNIANMAKQKRINIRNQVKDIQIIGDKQSLIELFVIFLDNSVKYSPKNSLITLSSKKIDDFVQVDIADKGVGISQEDLPHLFNRFYRADKSRTKSEVGGYGLGLSIAKQIVNEHKGFIKVESKFDKGSTFSIQLPIKS